MDQLLLSTMPQTWRERIRALPREILVQLEEIRVRKHQPIELIYHGTSRFMTAEGTLTAHAGKGWIPPIGDFDKMINLISRHSIYALEEELRRGYVTIAGGHRIGIAGKVVLDKGQIKTMRDISSLNIRVAKEKKGVALPLLPYLIEKGQLLNTLIISPPQCGKTTLLRDLARAISYGNLHLSGKKVGIVDERSEIAACVHGRAQRDVGPRADVLDACPKAEGIMMMVRSMSPDVIIADEIGRPEDATAIQEALNAGVAIMTSAHGANLSDIARRPTLSRMIGQGMFQRYVVLGRSNGVGTIEAIFDDHCRRIEKAEVS